MKTAISIPDDTFNAAERRAAELGISRSEFFTTAARRYLVELDYGSLTARIDDALERIEPDGSADFAVELSGATLAAGDDEW
ncbi:MAG: antitoxin [Actinobacteria bacterium]|nr:antitoxin [Actinomycetota bacterium]